MNSYLISYYTECANIYFEIGMLPIHFAEFSNVNICIMLIKRMGKKTIDLIKAYRVGSFVAT